MLRSNASGKLLTSADLRRRPRKVFQNFTEFFNEVLMSPLPVGRIDAHQLSIIGKWGSGKSTLITHIAEMSSQRYHPELMNLVYSDDLDVAVQLMDHKPYQLVILDDAAGAASSRKGGANAEKVQDYNTLRHILKRKQIAAGKPIGGLVNLVIAWQRKNDLERAMREADFQIWKTPPIEPEDQRILTELIGSRYMRKLKDIALRILLKDQNAKSESVAMISVLGMDGVGIYRSRDTSYKLPDIMTKEKYQAAVRSQLQDTGSGAGGIDDRAHGGRQCGPADAVKLRQSGMNATAIAKELGKSRATIYRWLKEAEASA